MSEDPKGVTDVVRAMHERAGTPAGLTTDPEDPRLEESKATGQQEVYLVLSPEERAKGFVRPLRESYLHIGVRPKYPTRELTSFEHANYDKYGYALYEEYPPESEEAKGGVCGRFWTKAQLASGCGSQTRMGTEIAATYARDPKFYGATYCVTCMRHFRVEEFVWEGTDERVGS